MRPWLVLPGDTQVQSCSRPQGPANLSLVYPTHEYEAALCAKCPCQGANKSCCQTENWERMGTPRKGPKHVTPRHQLPARGSSEGRGRARGPVARETTGPATTRFQVPVSVRRRRAPASDACRPRTSVREEGSLRLSGTEVPATTWARETRAGAVGRPRPPFATRMRVSETVVVVREGWAWIGRYLGSKWATGHPRPPPPP